MARLGATVLTAMPAAIGRKSNTISGLATVHGSTDRPGTISGTASGISSDRADGGDQHEGGGVGQVAAGPAHHHRQERRGGRQADQQQAGGVGLARSAAAA